MKKKTLLATLMVAALSVSMLFGCGNSTEESKAPAETAAPTEAVTDPATEAPTEAATEASKDGLTFDGEKFKVEYVKYEVGKDYEGNPCLYYYYDFTNKSDEATNSLVAAYIQVFQNGVELETAITDTESPEVTNSMKDIKNGVTLQCCNVYALTDESDLEIEVSDWTSFDGEKATQTLKLK